MKNLIAFSLIALSSAAVAEPTVANVLIRQNWPWDRSVRVEYSLSGVTDRADVTVTATSEGETFTSEQIRKALTSGSLFGASNGFNAFTLDPKKLFSDTKAKRPLRVTITVTGASDPYLDRIEYRVYDLENGGFTDLTRHAIYDHPETYGEVITDYSTVGDGFTTPLTDVFIATGFTNDVYKTKKLVMKRIPAKDVVWTMGPAEDDPNTTTTNWYYDHRRVGESRVDVKLSSDYFMAIYELTQEQYFRLTGAKPSYYSNPDWWSTRPVENVSQSAFLGEGGFAALATARFGKMVTLPTEAQWEFAAKAGYSGVGLPNGQDAKVGNVEALEDFAHRGHTGDPVSRDFANAHGIDGGGTYTVGRGKPNAYGLYDTLANVSEWTLDRPYGNLASYYAASEKPVVDPRATSDSLGSAAHRVYKGSNFNHISRGAYQCRLCARFAESNTEVKDVQQGLYYLGFRVMSPAD